MAGAREQPFVAAPIASAGGRVITSPFQFYTSGEDHLRIISVNSLTGVRLKIDGRFVTSKGALEAFSHDHIPNADRTSQTTTHSLAVGAVLNLTVHASSGSPSIGQAFVIVQLVRGLGPAGYVLGTLLQGYVTSTQHLAWPGSPIQNSIEGPGALRVIVGTTPAAGGEISETVPFGARWQLLSFFYVLTTSAAVGSRVSHFQHQNAAAFLARVPPVFGLGPGSVADFTWGQGLSRSQAIISIHYACTLATDETMPSGDVFSTLTDNFDVGDQYSAIAYRVREWLEVL